jgi:hypothetical protein
MLRRYSFVSRRNPFHSLLAQGSRNRKEAWPQRTQRAQKETGHTRVRVFTPRREPFPIRASWPSESFALRYFLYPDVNARRYFLAFGVAAKVATSVPGCSLNLSQPHGLSFPAD